ncbi:hypothetical protein [Rickettsia australis]|uniref:Uncharacterized protein n=1 Tax=Rickettsia australis (strain Cutlack) TaxID=1105110 RepID=H8K9Y7_RICAC|nr:hypothetical protein [Rickettsia australis]AFC71697.1 hypothetical protein MC5_07415 [Rickettsia australis str. Cutlack]
MRKKKFDLTSDLVEVSHATQIAKANNENKASSKVVLITLSIEEARRADFKSWCARHRFKMNEAFMEGFKLLKEKHGE